MPGHIIGSCLHNHCGRRPIEAPEAKTTIHFNTSDIIRLSPFLNVHSWAEKANFFMETGVLVEGGRI